MTVLEHRYVAERPAESRLELRAGREPRRAQRFLRGPAGDPRWVRPLLILLLATTAFMYLVDLSASGWGNPFYSAAVQAATVSWKAMFFGSSDAHGIVTVDKPPAALWVMGLSARAFGLSSWSVLAPQALEGVLTVGLVYKAARRFWTPGTGLLAGTLVAVTPIAANMFRFNNPDALLLLLLVGATYATLLAIDTGRTRWIFLAGALVGMAFMTKTLQAFLVLPALGGAYLLAGPSGLRRRLAQLAGGGAAMLLTGGWWIAVVELIPAAARPYIGGSADNNELNLIFGYNGLGRLSGAEKGSVGFTSPTVSGGGSPGLFRMFNDSFAGAIAWFIPVAVIALLLGLWLTRRDARTSGPRAALVAWGGSMVVTAGAFSLGSGIIHPYYSVALTPAVAVLAAYGFTELWHRRLELRWRVALAGYLATAVATADFVLSWSKGWGVGNDVAVGLVALLVSLIVLAGPRLRPVSKRVLGGACVVACLLGPLAVTVATVATPDQLASANSEPAAERSVGWLLYPSAVPARVAGLVASDAGSYRWAAAAAGSERAASYQLVTGDPVIAIGGFNATDPVPTLTAFQGLVAAHQVHWFIAGGPKQWTGGPDAAAIARWVAGTFELRVVDGTYLYDLSSGHSSR